MGGKDVIEMRESDRQRLKVIHEVMQKHLTQQRGAEVLGISERQVRRIVKRVRQEGDEGMIHRSRGCGSNRRISDKMKSRVLTLYRRKYQGFGPTFANEKIQQDHGITVATETLRGWLLEKGLWERSRQRESHRQWRERKACFGEMIQMDGSHHAWLEGRGPKMVLMAYIDDATSRVCARFADHEGTFPAMEGMKGYIRRYGIPQSVYLDRHSTYQSPAKERRRESVWLSGEALTQFERALRELGIKVIFAYSPQAKGRIERFFKTAQDRLVKEMRLRNIRAMEQANAYLPEYLRSHNEHFAVRPKEAADLHRPVPTGMDLDKVFCVRFPRVVGRDRTIRYRGQWYQITVGVSPGSQVTIRQTMKDRIILTDGRGVALAFREIRKQPKALKTPPAWKSHRPADDHPWRRPLFHSRKSCPVAAIACS